MVRTGSTLVITNAAGDYLMQFRDGTPGIERPLDWDFFGGGTEGDEDGLAAAARELEEELGIVATPQELELLGHFESEEAADAIVRYRKPLEWDGVAIREGAGCGFFTKEELLRLPLAAHPRGIVERYL